MESLALCKYRTVKVVQVVKSSVSLWNYASPFSCFLFLVTSNGFLGADHFEAPFPVAFLPVKIES